SAQVSSLELDRNITDNTAIAVTTVIPITDLSVSIAVAPDVTGVGQPLTYTVNVLNNGPNPALGVKLTDIFPEGFEFVAARANQGTCTNISGTVFCDFGLLGRLRTATMILTAKPTRVGLLTNEVSVDSLGIDPSPVNNQSAVGNDIVPDANLSINLSSPEVVMVGSNLTYVINVINNGPKQARGVQLIDALPFGFIFISAETTQGAFLAEEGIVAVNLGDMAAGGS